MSEQEDHQVNVMTAVETDSKVNVTQSTTSSEEHVCIICKNGEALYQPVACDCAFTYCKKCAMKCATGGKCKKCNAFFGSMRMSDHGSSHK